ncbi:MAG: extracellular solute-binding protein [Clostridia bacterium]|nr:extracellular solute-binding protein [Clostridia bacterium]
MRFKKITALALAALMLLASAVACAEKNPAGPADSSDTSAVVVPDSSKSDETTENVDENGYLRDDLPVLNYGGSDFVIFTWSNQTVWEWSEDENTTGDVIKDSIVKRQVNTEDRMGIKIVIESMNGDWDHRNEFATAVDASVQSGANDAYDLIGQYTPAAAIGAMKGCYEDLSQIEHLDLKKPWWPDDIYTSSSINGKVYSVAGDISPTLIRNMVCILTNLKLANDLKMPDFYELVDNHQWTADVFMTYATGTVTGLNADGSACYTTTITSNVCYDNVFYGGGFRFVERSTEDGLVLSDDLSSTKLADWFDLWSGFWKKEDVVALGVNAANGFTTGNVLFHFGQVSDVQNYLQEIDFDFGILPYPMYDEDQENYATICGYWVSLYSIPVNANDKAKSGAVLECLGSYGYRIITPAVYEVSFTYRYLNSPENAKIFNLLHDTLVFEPGRTFADQINCFAAFRQAAGVSSSWSVYFKSNGPLWKKNIQKVVSTLG